MIIPHLIQIARSRERVINGINEIRMAKDGKGAILGNPAEIADSNPFETSNMICGVDPFLFVLSKMLTSLFLA